MLADASLKILKYSKYYPFLTPDKVTNIYL